MIGFYRVVCVLLNVVPRPKEPDRTSGLVMFDTRQGAAADENNNAYEAVMVAMSGSTTVSMNRCRPTDGRRHLLVCDGW